MKSLTKENFWDKLYSKYPSEMKQFCEWIDEYKKKVNWNNLFPVAARNHYCVDIKFHHLPVAMQIGIFLQYVSESDNSCGIEIPIIENKADFNSIPEYIKDYVSLNQFAA